MEWNEIYEKGIKKYKTSSEWINNKIKYKKRFCYLIEKYVKKDGRILEAGCGSAAISIYLSNKGYLCTCIDISDDILKLAKRLSLEYGRKTPTFKNESIFDMNYEKDYFDVAFSNGVLEHFSDEEIINIIKKELLVAKTVIFGIPTTYFNENEKAFGNERFLKKKYWKKLIKKAGAKIIEEGNVHFLPVKKRIINFKKYFRPMPHHIFVVKNASR